MKRTLLASASLLALTLSALHAQTFPGIIGPNGQVTWPTDQLFQSGRPWCDVRAEGALGNASADDSPAFEKCLQKLNAVAPSAGNGGILFVPPGNYCIKSIPPGKTAGIDVDGIGVGVIILGSGNASPIQACGTDITVVRLNTSKSAIYNAQVIGNGYNGGGGAGTIGNITHPALLVDSNCVGCRVDHAQVYAGSIPFVANTADIYIGDVGISLGYGAASLQLSSTIPGGASAIHMVRTQVDSAAPTGVFPTGSSIPAWSAGHVYAANDYVSLNGYYIAARVGGTSGGSPPTLQPFSIDINDGTVKWQLVGPVNYCGLLVDGGGVEIDITAADFSNMYGTAAICLHNNNGGSPPGFVKINNSVISNGLGPYTIDLRDGNYFAIETSEIFGCFSVAATCPGINVQATFSGQVIIANNWFGGQYHAILLGANGATITGNQFGVGGANTLGVNVGAGVSDFTIVGNYFANVTNFGVNVNAGASNHYRIWANAASPSTGFAVNDNGTGTDKIVDYGDGSFFSQAWYPQLQGTNKGATITGPTAPGPGQGGLIFECGTNAGTAGLYAGAGTSNTWSRVLDNIGSGVTGC